MGKDVIIACDFESAEKTLAFLDRFTGRRPFVKIGMELFYAAGPAIVREIKRRGHKIFLDLKLHDIPNTVKKTMAVLSGLDADIVNLHAAGTRRMMEAALEGLTRPDGTRPLLIAVTQLTSTDRQSLEEELLIREPMEKARAYMKQAVDAEEAGLDGTEYVQMADELLRKPLNDNGSLRGTFGGFVRAVGIYEQLNTHDRCDREEQYDYDQFHQEQTCF